MHQHPKNSGKKVFGVLQKLHGAVTRRRDSILSGLNRGIILLQDAILNHFVDRL